jgi:hypothetical protein
MWVRNCSEKEHYRLKGVKGTVHLMSKRNEKISISLSRDVLKAVETEATRENRSRSNYIETILMSHLKELSGQRKMYAVDEKP